MKISLLNFIVIGLLALDMTSCSNVEAPHTEPLVLYANESRAASAMQSFDQTYFTACCENISKGNLAVSPLSARLFLLMFANSIEGEAVNEITAALNTADLEAINTLSQKLSAYLPRADRNVNVAIANSVWYQQALTVNKPFEESAQHYYGVEFFSTDFQATDAGNKINGWVKKSTNGIIDHIVDNGSMDLVASVLLNTLYYKGAWDENIKFDKSKTRKETFHGAVNDNTVDMMHNTVDAQYYKHESYQAVKLPMGKNGKFEALFVLPNESTGTDGLLFDYTLGFLSEKPFEIASVELSMPKFKLNPDKIMLEDIFKSMGINSMDESVCKLFEQKIDATHNIFQKSVIEVNEEGAEAADVTGDLWCTVDIPDKQVKLTFNHPFFMFINEKTSGACLFAARVNEL